MLSPPRSSRDWLEPALTDGDTWADVEQRLTEQTAQLWIGGECAMVTEIWGDCLHVWLAGGRLRSIMELRPGVEETARHWGLKRITISGRPGWDRVLKRVGYARNGVELEKRL